MNELLFWVKCTSCSEYLGYYLLEGAAREAKNKHEAKTGHKVLFNEVKVKGEKEEQ